MNLNSVARRYSGTMQAYKHIYQNEGFRGLWKGAAQDVSHASSAQSQMCHSCLPASLGTLPNITRNALVNCTELVTYDMIKEAILKHKLMSGLTHTHSNFMSKPLNSPLKLWGPTSQTWPYIANRVSISISVCSKCEDRHTLPVRRLNGQNWTHLRSLLTLHHS